MIPRAGMLVAAFLAAVLGLPTPVLAPLGCLGLLVTAELAGRGRDGLDRLLVGAGFLLCAAVLGGMGLATLPSGLTRRGWACYWLAVGLALVVVRRGTAPARIRPTRRWIVPGVAAALVLAAFAFSALDSGRQTTGPLALWLVDRASTGITVGVDGGDAGTELRVVLADQPTGATSWVSAPFHPAGTARLVTVPVPAAGRWRVELVPLGAAEPVRELVVDLST
jgi:hypothetical protein